MRILIATVTAGGGHLAAAAAMHEAWSALRPSDTIERLDLVRFFSPLHRKVHADGYVKLVEHAPEIWGMLFGKTDNPDLARRLMRFRRMFPSQSRVRFAKYLNQFKPDVVLCTHYAPLETLAELKPGPESKEGTEGKPRRHSLKTSRFPRPAFPAPFVVSIVTDFEAHALWMAPGVDLYCVAAEETKARLVARGAEPAKALATGIPISKRFCMPANSAAVRKAMGLRDDLPVVLVLSGGFGMGPVAAILNEMDKVEREFQAVVVTGRNEELRRELATVDRKHPTHIVGYASNMHELMAAAELIVTKPGGLTTSEALALGKPIFIVQPIPGQEAANSDFLLERGAAAKVNRTEDLPYRLTQLLGSTKLAEMAKAAKALGRPEAAKHICEAVLERLKSVAHAQ